MKHKKTEIPKKERIRRLIMGSLIIIAVLSLGYFIFYNQDSSENTKKNQKLSGLKNTDFVLYEPEKATVKLDDPIEKPNVLDDYVTLYNKNKRFRLLEYS